MTDQHPITPPPELVAQWSLGRGYSWNYIATQAARWGADTELAACCEWVEREIGHGREWGAELRRLRRPKPKSRKQRALDALAQMEDIPTGLATEIRQALEELPDD